MQLVWFSNFLLFFFRDHESHRAVCVFLTYMRIKILIDNMIAKSEKRRPITEIKVGNIEIMQTYEVLVVVGVKIIVLKPFLCRLFWPMLWVPGGLLPP